MGARRKPIIPFSFGVLAESPLKAMDALKKPAVAAVMLALLLMHRTDSALAASGGVMGGSSSGSSSSGSYSWNSSSSSITRSSSSSEPFPRRWHSHSDDEVDVQSEKGLPDGFLLVLLGFVAFMHFVVLLDFSWNLWNWYTCSRITVVKLQIGLSGMAKELQRDLDRIAETADTSNRKGYTYVLRETTSSLLRHPPYFVSGYSFVDVKVGIEKVEKCFKRLSEEEREKFDEVTLSNVDNVKKKSTFSHKTSESQNEYIVVTILVAAEGVHKVRAIKGSGDLKEALEKLRSIPTSSTLAVEVLWTPQDLNDTLSEQELLRDYPRLRPLTD